MLSYLIVPGTERSLMEMGNSVELTPDDRPGVHLDPGLFLLQLHTIKDILK